MVNSMTAFGTASGSSGALAWAWEIRSVNGRGLDLRLRLPEGFEGLEPELRKAVAEVARRGNVTVALRLRRAEEAARPRLDPAALEAALEALAQAQALAARRGLEAAPSDLAHLLALPGVLARGEAEDAAEAAGAEIRAGFAAALAAFAEARAAEGAALAGIISGQLDRIEALLAEARAALPARTEAARTTLRENVARLLEATDRIEEDRLAQELALIAVKSDVAEELDRLAAHLAAARKLLAARGPVGRTFDFLTQEFNREANTLCAKAGFEPLTRAGLDLKTVIDQMREQVQNVE